MGFLHIELKESEHNAIGRTLIDLKYVVELYVTYERDGEYLTFVYNYHHTRCFLIQDIEKIGTACIQTRYFLEKIFKGFPVKFYDSVEGLKWNLNMQ